MARLAMFPTMTNGLADQRSDDDELGTLQL